jgi:hypothetical protein
MMTGNSVSGGHPGPQASPRRILPDFPGASASGLFGSSVRGNLSNRLTMSRAFHGKLVQAVPSSMSGSASILHPQDEAMEQADASRW